MFNKIFYWGIFLILLFATTANSQTLTIKGNVTNSETNLPLPNSNVFIPKLNIGTTTDFNGLYEIENLKIGSYTIKDSYIGFKTIFKNVTLTKDATLNFKLIVVKLNEIPSFGGRP